MIYIYTYYTYRCVYCKYTVHIEKLSHRRIIWHCSKGIGCNLGLIFFLLNLPFSQPMLLKPAVYFDGNQVEIMKLHKSSPYSKICLNLGALHPSSPEKHLMIISILWPDPRCRGHRLKNEGQKSTQ